MLFRDSFLCVIALTVLDCPVILTSYWKIITDTVPQILKIIDEDIHLNLSLVKETLMNAIQKTENTASLFIPIGIQGLVENENVSVAYKF